MNGVITISCKLFLIFLLLITTLTTDAQIDYHRTLYTEYQLPLLSKTKPLQNAHSFSWKRAAIVYGSSGLMWGSALIGLNELWYKDYPRSSFHFYNDKKEWLQVDKAGHAMTAYFESRWAYNMGIWAGVKPGKAAFIGAGLGWSYQLSMELLDAYSQKWGFSWYDIAANTLGSSLFLTQQLIWNEQRISLKYFTATPKYPDDPMIHARVAALYGTGFWQQKLKDYNAQTYWLSFNLSSFIKTNVNIPKWLNIAIGYSAEGMLGGFQNEWTDNTTLIQRNDIKRYRQFFISPDIDFTKIKTKYRAVKMGLQLINIFKAPAPAIEINSLGKLKFYPVYFLNWHILLR